MAALPIIILHPKIQILLQLGNAAIDLLAESYCIKLILNGFVEALTDAIGLRTLAPPPDLLPFLCIYFFEHFGIYRPLG